MDVFGLRARVVGQYAEYVRSFQTIRDSDTRAFVDRHLDDGRLWPEPLIQLNSSFQPGASVDQFVAEDVLHVECSRIFQRGKTPTSFGTPLQLHKHQEDAIRVAATGAAARRSLQPAGIRRRPVTRGQPPLSGLPAGMAEPRQRVLTRSLDALAESGPLTGREIAQRLSHLDSRIDRHLVNSVLARKGAPLVHHEPQTGRYRLRRHS